MKNKVINSYFLITLSYVCIDPNSTDSLIVIRVLIIIDGGYLVLFLFFIRLVLCYLCFLIQIELLRYFCCLSSNYYFIEIIYYFEEVIEQKPFLFLFYFMNLDSWMQNHCRREDFFLGFLMNYSYNLEFLLLSLSLKFFSFIFLNQ